MAAVARAFQDEPDDQVDDHHHDDGHRDAPEVSVADALEIQGAGDYRLAFGDGVGEATQERHRAECDDERRERKIGGQHAVDKAVGRADRKAYADGGGRRHPGYGCDDGDHAGNGDDRSDGEFNATGQDDKRHPRRQNGVHRYGARNVEEVIDAVEVWRGGRHQNDQREQHHQDAGAIPPSRTGRVRERPPLAGRFHLERCSRLDSYVSATGRGARRVKHHFFFGGFLRDQFGHDPALAHDQEAIAYADSFR